MFKTFEKKVNTEEMQFSNVISKKYNRIGNVVDV